MNSVGEKFEKIFGVPKHRYDWENVDSVRPLKFLNSLPTELIYTCKYKAWVAVYQFLQIQNVQWQNV
jgi:hypothetical protein